MRGSTTDAIRLLIVEHDPDAAARLIGRLEREGMNLPHRRVDSEDGLIEALEAPWDIVISEYASPGLDGLRAAQLVRETDRELPLIFVARVIDRERAVDAMRAGARDLLPRDDFARLSDAVRREVDATRQRAADRASSERARAFAQSIVSSVPTPIIILDFDGVVIAVNPEFERRFCEVHAPGEDTFVNVCGEIAEHTEVREALARAIAGEETPEVAVDLIDDDGPRHLIARVRPLRTTAQNEPYILLTLQDITRWRRMYDRLVTAQRLESVGRLAGGVAHDFNNMLTIIQNFAAVLQSGEFSEQEPHEIGDVLMEVSERAATLTRQLLAFGRRRAQDLVVTDVNEMFVELTPVLRRLSGEEINFVFEFDQHPSPVRVDREQMEQVVLNLVSNSVEAMPNGGTITVTTRSLTLRPEEASLRGAPPGEWTVFSIRDTGTGMDPATTRHVFEPFFTTQEFGVGAGLGLSTVYGAVRQAKGHVSLSTQPGEGTEVSVFLPVDPDGAVDDQMTDETGSEQTRRILLVEDDDLVRRSTRRVLERAGFDVMEAARGTAALQLISETPCDVLLTDVLLPDMDGVQLVRQALAELDDPPKIILASGYPSDEVLDDSLDFDALFIQKPFRPAALVARLNQLKL